MALGAVGLPVFSGMKGGFSVLVGPTGGYIYGFVGMAALCGLGAYLFLRLTKRKGAVMKALGTAAAVVCGLAGLAVCHVCGTIQFAALTGRTFGEAAMLASVPYLAKDIISVVGAFAVGSVISMRVVNK
ncbi:MAG: biotin transporter BioY [Eubacteriales bacterium]